MLKYIAKLIPILTIATIIHLPFSAFSQSTADIKRQVLGLKKKPLTVILETENKAYAARLKKKGKTEELAEYKRKIAYFNSSIQTAVKAVWEFSENVNFITRDEYPAYKKAEGRRSAFLSLLTVSYSANHHQDQALSTSHSFGVNFQPDGASVPFLTVAIPSSSVTLSSGFIPEGENTPGHLAAALIEMQFSLRFFANGGDKKSYRKAYKGDEKLLKDYTIVINRNHLGKSLQNTDLASKYSIPIKVVDQEEFDDLILKRVPGHAIIYPFRLKATTANPKGLISSTNATYAQYVFAPDKFMLLKRFTPIAVLGGTSGGLKKVRTRSLDGIEKSAKKN